jgi:hypothetical protein
MRINGIELPPGTRWVNEHDWSGWDTSLQRTVSGHSGITKKKLTGGRPILLEFRATDWPLLSFEKMEQLKTVLDTAEILLFASSGKEYLVTPNSIGGKCYEFRPIFDYQDQSKNYYVGKLDLITI